MDKRRVLLPDRRGNNRIDSLRNIVRDPRVSLLFMVPGVGETLRINGTAQLLCDHDLCLSFALNEKAPKCVISVTVDRIYYQCQKALHRSRLWDPTAFAQAGEVPTAGEMLKATVGGEFDDESYDRDYPEHMARTIY
ncbi:MAG: pyridoxamine 5'-phosphate oxidase family protein [Minwuia sp.]|nr:pyridoxamine 5'-phosphate oxidase family protein [Minwuia sp.]